MAHKIETMAYRMDSEADRPWHGLGVSVPHDVDPYEMMKLAGLDWRVSALPVFIRVGDEFRQIPGRAAVTRDRDNRVFAVMTDSYRPIQNHEIFAIMKRYADAGHMTIDTAGALKGGSVVWALAKVNGEFSLSGGDHVRSYFLLSTSHDGSLSFTARFTPVRVVCWNTLTQSFRSGTWSISIRHVGASDVVDEASRAVDRACNLMQQVERNCRALSEAEVQDGQSVYRYLIELLYPKLHGQILSFVRDDGSVEHRDGSMLDYAVYATEEAQQIRQIRELASRWQQGEIREQDLGLVGRAVLRSITESPGSYLPSAYGTWWGVYNGVTYYVDHQAGRSQDSRLHSAWFGDGARMKQGALELALRYSGMQTAQEA